MDVICEILPPPLRACSLVLIFTLPGQTVAAQAPVDQGGSDWVWLDGDGNRSDCDSKSHSEWTSQNGAQHAHPPSHPRQNPSLTPPSKAALFWGWGGGILGTWENLQNLGV